jgi:hypothetical protein
MTGPFRRAVEEGTDSGLLCDHSKDATYTMVASGP